MGVHRLTVYNYMNELRAMGAEIEYDKKRIHIISRNTFNIQLIISSCKNRSEYKNVNTASHLTFVGKPNIKK